MNDVKHRSKLDSLIGYATESGRSKTLLLYTNFCPPLSRKRGTLNLIRPSICPIVRPSGRCEVELKFTVHYSLFGPNSEL